VSITSLYLNSFRNYEEAFFEFDEGINLIYGANAQGKTSILEAIYCLIVGRSFRSNNTKDLIQYHQSGFSIDCRFTQYEVEQSLRFLYNGKQRTFFHNYTPLPQVSSLIGILSGVLITPDDIELIKGQPVIRRQFLDLQLAQVDPLYIHHLTRYQRALQQRNQLLKMRQVATLSIWEEEMGRSAAYITMQRGRLLNELEQQGERFHRLLSKENHIWTLDYKTGGVELSHDGEVLYRHQLDLFKQHRERELVVGYTLSGPHKDDFSLRLNQKDVKFFASEGQQRTSVIALRLAEWQRLDSNRDDSPLLMIDDVGMGLDHTRRSNLFHLLNEFHQVFLTATEASLFDEVQVKGKKIKIG
jgi:DNA replication and repair protein RecF